MGGVWTCVKFECWLSARGGLGGAISREGLGGRVVHRGGCCCCLPHGRGFDCVVQPNVGLKLHGSKYLPRNVRTHYRRRRPADTPEGLPLLLACGYPKKRRRHAERGGRGGIGREGDWVVCVWGRGEWRREVERGRGEVRRWGHGELGRWVCRAVGRREGESGREEWDRGEESPECPRRTGSQH